jgi:hypothetical protein
MRRSETLLSTSAHVAAVAAACRCPAGNRSRKTAEFSSFAGGEKVSRTSAQHARSQTTSSAAPNRVSHAVVRARMPSQTSPAQYAATAPSRASDLVEQRSHTGEWWRLGRLFD